MTHRLLSLLLATLALLSSGCAVFGSRDPDDIGRIERANASHHLDLARGELDRQEYGPAIDRLIEVRRLRGIRPEERNRLEGLLDECVSSILNLVSGEGFDSSDLEEIFELDISPRLRARAGMMAAERMLAEDSRIDASRMIMRVERELPTHPERQRAAEILADAGFSMARGGGRYRLIFFYRARGVEALEYLVVTYPLFERCDEAYDLLGRLYEDADELDKAIARYEDLLVYHPQSPYAPEAEARIPYLRLLRLDRDDFDQGEMLTAQAEIARWLATHPGHELASWMEEVRAECGRRIARSELILAHYYLDVGNPLGARNHAESALAEATAVQVDEEAARARSLLARIPDSGNEQASEDTP